ncbi:hypothetical protein [Abyssalbus ytuae]|uniref:Uncharacterized protein n=1 Tax=Abyssalbus ytuae TaxID=2926907 RepID=A0A9E7D1Z2_9FLAO|nr:hypothetical protein [Abyssalbus ytuae]UOB17618.1 hypothetical protein MQE35_17995 [Abyssalbus ytuae]
MKINSIFLVIFITIYLIIFAIFAQLNVKTGFLFYALFIGQLIFLFTVYRVLKDNYKTSKTFRDWYEDKPIEK